MIQEKRTAIQDDKLSHNISILLQTQRRGEYIYTYIYDKFIRLDNAKHSKVLMLFNNKKQAEKNEAIK